MFGLGFIKSADSPLSILCIGAHSDDIEIGCGGTILSILERCPRVTVTWVALSSEGVRAEEARRSAARILAKAQSRHIITQNFRNSYFPYVAIEIKEYFNKLKNECNPDIIFTHYRQDLHQDHRLTSELTWNAFRNHFILEYEIPKYDGDFGTPNVFVPIDESVAKEKIDTLFESFPSQQDKQWFDRETFLAVLRLRGMECHAPTRYAEAFYSRKILLRPPAE